jgi:sugar phosphate isomerase/epimerase
MNLDHFGMDTITLAGPLEAKLRAVREAGFSQIMLSARDVVGHPDGESAGVATVRASGLRVTGFQVLRDFEGFSGHLPPTRSTSPRRCSRSAARSLAHPARVLVTSTHAANARTRARPAQARDARGAPRDPHRVRGTVLGPARQ